MKATVQRIATRYGRLLTGFARVCERYGVPADDVASLRYYVLDYAQQHYVDRLVRSDHPEERGELLSWLEAKLSNWQYFLEHPPFAGTVPRPVMLRLYGGVSLLMADVGDTASRARHTSRCPMCGSHRS